VCHLSFVIKKWSKLSNLAPLEAAHCIDNFRIAVGEKEGFREGFFFSDWDACKWLDAASRVYALRADLKLGSLAVSRRWWCG
jgi:DUF1680 family protein